MSTGPGNRKANKYRVVHVDDRMQSGYSYVCTEPIGKHFDPTFTPDLTPSEMLSLGVFGGRYLRDCVNEFPRAWFTQAKFAVGAADPKCNFFGVAASKPLKYWQQKGWIYPEDPRGWFQWYCRYYMGRRIPLEDQRQIKRWKAIRRHIAQLQKHCRRGQLTCRPVQRQALLHWAYDSRQL